jgi:hypothetical protein
MRKRAKPAKTVEQKLRRDVALLKEMCPLLLPVRVYRRPLKLCLGYTSLRFDKNGHPSHFVIHLDKAMSWDALWQTLIHEWAHALSWIEGETICDHDPAWALALARIYQETVEP